MTETYNPIIADAKRRARRHAREAGVPYQTALDHIARIDGHDGWAALVGGPTLPAAKPDAFSRFNGVLARLAEDRRTGLLLYPSTVLLIALAVHVLHTANPRFPDAPAWLVAIAFAAIVPVVGGFTWYMATYSLRVLQLCRTAVRTGACDIDTVRGLLSTISLGLWLASVAAVFIWRDITACVALTLGSWLPVLLNRTLLRGPRKRRQTT